MGCPLHRIKRSGGGGEGRPPRRAQGGSPTPGGSRIPPSLVGVGEGRKGEKEGRKGCRGSKSDSRMGGRYGEARS